MVSFKIQRKIFIREFWRFSTFSWISNGPPVIFHMILDQTNTSLSSYWFWNSMTANNIRRLGVPFEFQLQEQIRQNLLKKYSLAWMLNGPFLLEIYFYLLDQNYLKKCARIKTRIKPFFRSSNMASDFCQFLFINNSLYWRHLYSISRWDWAEESIYGDAKMYRNKNKDNKG